MKDNKKKIVGVYRLITYDDGSIETSPMPFESIFGTRPEDGELSVFAINASERIKQVMSTIQEVGDALSLEPEKKPNLLQFKVLVSMGVKRTANVFSVAVPTVSDKLCRKSRLRMDQFVEYLYEVLVGKPCTVETYKDSRLWEHIVFNCDTNDQNYAEEMMEKILSQLKEKL